MTDERASTGATRSDAGATGTGATGVDADGTGTAATERPYVDGTAASAEELRAEVDRLSYDERRHVDELREEVGDSIAELAARFDVKSRVAERRDDAVAAVQQQVGRARVAATEGAAAAKDTARERPGAIAAAVAALIALFVLVVLRRRTTGAMTPTPIVDSALAAVRNG